jgi:hypothetical protein
MTSTAGVPPWRILAFIAAGLLTHGIRGEAPPIGPLKETTDRGRTWHDEGWTAPRQSGGDSGSQGSSAQQLERQKGFELCQDGVKQLDRGNVDEAIALLWNAFSRLPDDPAVRRALGSAQNAKGLEYLNKGLWPEAVDQFGYALEKCPGDAVFRENLARALEMNRQARTERDGQHAIRQIQGDLQNLVQELSAGGIGAGQPEFLSTGPGLMSARHSGEIAVELANRADKGAATDSPDLPYYEPASEEARRGWDTRAAWAGTVKAGPLHGLSPSPAVFSPPPKEYENDRIIRTALQAQRRALAEKAGLQAALAKTRQAREEATAARQDAGPLEVLEAGLIDRLSKADSTAYTEGLKIQDRARMLHFHVAQLETSDPQEADQP